MARYYFDLQSSGDEHGEELPDVAAVRRYALRYAAELIREIDVGARGMEYWRMDVREQDGDPVFSVVVELLPAKAGEMRRNDAQLRRVGT